MKRTLSLLYRKFFIVIFVAVVEFKSSSRHAYSTYHLNRVEQISLVFDRIFDFHFLKFLDLLVMLDLGSPQNLFVVICMTRCVVAIYVRL